MALAGKSSIGTGDSLLERELVIIEQDSRND
jgi:hypothetical protein